MIHIFKCVQCGAARETDKDDNRPCVFCGGDVAIESVMKFSYSKEVEEEMKKNAKQPK